MAIATRGKSAAAKGGKLAKADAPTTVAENTIRVLTTVLEGGKIKGEPVEREEREVVTLVADAAKATAGIKLGYNKNLGNMEMAKIEVFVSMHGYAAEFDSLAGQVQDKAKEWLDNAVADLNVQGDVAGAEDVRGAGDQPEMSEEGDPEEGVTAEYIDDADRDALVALIQGNPDTLGDIDPDIYVDDADLREVIKAVIFGEGGTQEGDAEAGTDEGLHTEESLNEASTEDLQAQWEAWEMGKWPVGPEKLARKAAIKKILEKQAELVAEPE